MTQHPTLFCTNCGTPMIAGQRFCSNCGTVTDGEPSMTTMHTPGNITPPPPPPPTNPFAQEPYASTTEAYQPGPVNYQPPSYAQPQKNDLGRVLGQIGCGMGLIIVLVLALCAGAGYWAYHLVSVPAGNGNNSTQTSQRYSATQSGSSSSNTGTSNNTGTTATTQGQAKTTSLNGALLYSSVKITLINAQQANAFQDEHATSPTDMLRLNFREENTAKNNPNFLYSDVMRLILPDQTSVVPLSSQNEISPDSSVTRNNWTDFPVPLSANVKQLTLRLGTATQAQLDIPLTGSADLSKYQPKTVTPNKQASYAGATWTITKATEQLSAEAKQADKGMTYVIVTLRVDNNSASAFRDLPEDYMRLKAGDTTVTDTDANNFPSEIASGQTNATGDVVFLVPQGNTSFTLILLAAPSTNTTQPVTIPFTIQ